MVLRSQSLHRNVEGSVRGPDRVGSDRMVNASEAEREEGERNYWTMDHHSNRAQ